MDHQDDKARREEVRALLMRPRCALLLIRELEAKAKAAEDAMLPRGVSYDRARVQKSRGDPMAALAARLDELAEQLSEARARYLAETRAVEAMIDGLGDERIVLTMRYLCGMRWEEIADALHYSADRVYQLHRIGIKKLQSGKDYSKLQ